MTLIFLYEKERNKENMLKASIIIILWGVLFGSISEYIQYAYVVERKGNLFDLIADITGTLMAVFGYFFVIRKILSRK